MTVFCYSMLRRTTRSTHFPYTTLFRSCHCQARQGAASPVSAARQAKYFTTVSACSVPEYIASYKGLWTMDSTVKRSEEHTSELQSRLHLVCRLLLEKKK